MNLDEKLTRLRKEKGLTQLELAEHMKVSRQAVSRWEVGAAAPTTENLKSLSELYGVSLEYLLNDKEEPDTKDSVPPQEKVQDAPKKPDGKEYVKAAGLILLAAVILALAVLIVVTHSKGNQEENLQMEAMEVINTDDISKEEFDFAW